MRILRLYKLIHANAVQYKTNKAIILLSGSLNPPLNKEGQCSLGRKQPALFNRGRLFCYMLEALFFRNDLVRIYS